MKKLSYTPWWIGLGLVALSRLPMMAFMPLADTTEARYGFIAMLMVQTNNWITPFFKQDIPFWGKPPLSFWAQAGSAKLLGLNEFALRFPAWIAAILVGVLVYALASALKQRFTGIIAALCFATMGLSYFAAGGVMTDMFFTLGTTLTIVSIGMVALKRSPLWGYGFFLGIVIGLLAKGPLVLAILGIALVGWKLVAKKQASFSELPWVSGTILMLVLALPWYILAEYQTPGFLNYFIIGEHIQRFLQPGWTGDLYGDGHRHLPGTIWLYTFLMSLPILPLLFIHAKRNLSLLKHPSPQTSVYILLIMSALAPALLFTVARNILTTYALPSLPFLAVLAACISAPYLKRHARQATVLFSLTPLICTGILLYMTFGHNAIRTEKDLVATYMETRHNVRTPLYYMGELPYSAQFYSRGQAELLDVNGNVLHEPQRGLRYLPYFIAVPKDPCKLMLNDVNNTSPVLFENKSHCLFYMKDRNA